MKAVEPISIVFSALLTVLVVGCSSNTPTPETLSTEECAVYSYLIRNMYESELTVIQEETQSYSFTDGTIESISNSLPGIEQETLNEFRQRNENKHTLTRCFDLSGSYLFVSEREIEDIFEGLHGWDDFYKRYPGSQGIMVLSMVGFNNEKNQAIVSVGNQSNWLAGEGYYVFLVKEDGKWSIKGQLLEWVS